MRVEYLGGSGALVGRGARALIAPVPAGAPAEAVLPWEGEVFAEVERIA